MGEISIDPKFNIHETYKKVRILNPYRNVSPIGGVDPDYQAVLDYAAGNFIDLPSAAQQDIDNQLIINYKVTGAWDLDDVFFKFKGTATPAFKLICWKRRIEAQAFGGLTWSDSGVKGNGTNAYIKSGYIPSATNKWSLNDASVAFSSFALNTVGCIVGSYSNSNDSIYIAPRSSTSYFGLNSNLFNTDADYRTLGYTSYNRISPSFLTINTTDIASDSGAVTSLEIYILARNNSGNIADIFGDAGLEFVSFGSSKKSIHNTIKALF